MRPAARFQATIEIISEIEEAIATGGRPADSIVQLYFRARRYAGSKDRRFVRELVFAVLRERELLLWMIEAVGSEVSSRLILLVYLKKTDDPLDLFGVDEPHAPAAISDDEFKVLSQLDSVPLVGQPWHVTHNVPSWASNKLKVRFGDAVEPAAKALNDRASLNIRVNTLKTDRDTQMEGLSIAGYLVREGVYSNSALIAEDLIALQTVAAYQDGLIEVQDEAAQVAVDLVPISENSNVLDLCAGAGGKSLALAAKMNDSGTILATDIDAGRLRELDKRATRAGLDSINIHHLKGNQDQSLNDLSSSFDSVVVDVPCSGSGTWRRTPDLRWRYNDDSLTALTKEQGCLLRTGAELTRVGGVLVYMTCSVFEEENEQVVNAFLKDNDQFALIPWDSYYHGDVELNSRSKNQEMLQLTPYDHGTDGFFVAILKRLS